MFAEDVPDDIDRTIRINELKHEAEELAGGQMTAWEADNAPPGLLESFWENVVAYEKAPLTSDFQQLATSGVILPPPEEMDDAELSVKVWDLVRELARRRTFLHHTDHLSDRELYAHLWNESLREAKPDMPVNQNCMFGIDLIGTGSEEDNQLYMKFYADDEWREDWAKSWPEDNIPAKEKPPYDRDRLLPKSEW